MIIDWIRNISSYINLGNHFADAVKWLKKTDLDTLSCGCIDIAGEQVFATLAENRLSRGEASFEAHRRYADIQIILEGKEGFFLGTEAEILPPEPGTDFCPCRVGNSLEFTLEPGQFAVFLPGEAHSPGNAAGEHEFCKKLVVKVLMA